MSENPGEAGGVRLNKALADAGLCSRRKADELIFAGRVTVNGMAADSPGLRVGASDLVEVDGRQINLTPREFDLLTVLMSHPDVAFSRKRLLDIIWGGELSTDTRTLDTHIQHIRCAIVPYSDRIVTLRGVGYRFEKE